jgi:hypothetical protein
MSEEQEYYEDITGEIYNLTAAYGNLLEIDKMLLDTLDQDRLNMMKETIFTALEKRCEALSGED